MDIVVDSVRLEDTSVSIATYSATLLSSAVFADSTPNTIQFTPLDDTLSLSDSVLTGGYAVTNDAVTITSGAVGTHQHYAIVVSTVAVNTTSKNHTQTSELDTLRIADVSNIGTAYATIDSIVLTDKVDVGSNSTARLDVLQALAASDTCVANVVMNTTDSTTCSDGASIIHTRSLTDTLVVISTTVEGKNQTSVVHEVFRINTPISGGSVYTSTYSDSVLINARASWDAYGHALVINRTTSGVSRYDSAHWVAALNTPRGVVVVTPDGFHTLESSASVHANVTYGVTDLGRSGEIRLENLWVDLVGGEGLTATLSTLGASPQRFTYPIEIRASGQARTTRFVPGRGMVGRYWGIQLDSDLPFEIVDMSADIAESRRRV